MTVRLLCATHAGLFRAEIDTEAEEAACARLQPHHWQGLAPTTRGCLGFRRRLWAEQQRTRSDAFVVEAETGDLEPFHHPELKNLDGVHQVLAADGGLYICETGNNRLLFFDLDVDPEEAWPWHEHLFGSTAFDVHHPNCLHYLSPGSVAVVLHNRGRGPSELAEMSLDDGVGFTMDRVWRFPHEHVHDIFPEAPDRLLYLASEAGSLVDLSHGKIRREVEIGGYVKGLAATEDHLFVGSSPEAERKDRADTEGTVTVLDRDSLESRFRFSPAPAGEGPSGNINDLLITETSD